MILALGMPSQHICPQNKQQMMYHLRNGKISKGVEQSKSEEAVAGEREALLNGSQRGVDDGAQRHYLSLLAADV